MSPGEDSRLNAKATDYAKQVNFGGSNYAPIYLLGEQGGRRPVRQLPASPRDFTGRQAVTDRIVALLEASDVPIVNLYGLPGVGKSAVAISVANRLAKGRHSDCQLYFDLRKSEQGPATSYDLLGSQLIALGVPHAEVPSGTAPRSAAYRSALTGMRSVLVIDNASTAAEIEPLLPGDSGAAVLVTSWAPIPELPGVHLEPLGVLGDPEAVAMLRAVAAREVDNDDERLAADVAQLLGNLPLALRIAGGLLKARQHWSWTDLKEKIAGVDGRPKFHKLVAGSLALSRVFEAAYHALEPGVAQGYKKLGLAPSAAMSRGLAEVLVDADPERAEEIIDVLLVRQLLQTQTENTVRMHDLLWQWARKLAEDDDPQSLRSTIDRVTNWSLTQFDKRYLVQFRGTISLVTPIGGLTRARVEASDAYVDTPVRMDDGRYSLAEIFPARARVILLARGGAGKTTMINHLCRAAAQRRLTDEKSPIPIVALLRDTDARDDDGSLSSLLLRTLRHRYDVELSPDALRILLLNGQVFLVLDGLDEVVDNRLRQSLLTAIQQFVITYPRASLLVSTRPYFAVETDFPGFELAHTESWGSAQSIEYLAKLLGTTGRGDGRASRLRELAARASGSGLLDNPMGLQLLLAHAERDDRSPQTFSELIEALISKTAIEREHIRGTLYVDKDRVRSLLERIAYTMQSSSTSRVAITQSDLLDICQGYLIDLDQRPPAYYVERVVATITERSDLLREVSTVPEPVFTFRHTAIREHLAAAYVGRLGAYNVSRIIEEHVTDASWEAIIRTAFELRLKWQGPEALNQIFLLVGRSGNPATIAAMKAL
jgi:NACHT domain-containing protein